MPESRTSTLALPPCPACQRPPLRFTGVSHAPQQLTIAVRCAACDRAATIGIAQGRAGARYA